MQDPTLCSLSIYWLYMSLIFSMVKAIDGFSTWMNKNQSRAEMYFKIYADCVQAATGSILQREG